MAVTSEITLLSNCNEDGRYGIRCKIIQREHDLATQLSLVITDTSLPEKGGAEVPKAAKTQTVTWPLPRGLDSLALLFYRTIWH
jgi:hypothetical protein